MRISELINELGKFGRQDAIIVNHTMQPISNIYFLKQGSDVSKDLFVVLDMEPICKNTYTEHQLPTNTDNADWPSDEDELE